MSEVNYAIAHNISQCMKKQMVDIHVSAAGVIDKNLGEN